MRLGSASDASLRKIMARAARGSFSVAGEGDGPGGGFREPLRRAAHASTFTMAFRVNHSSEEATESSRRRAITAVVTVDRLYDALDQRLGWSPETYSSTERSWVNLRVS